MMNIIKKVFRFVYERNWLRLLICFSFSFSFVLMGVLLGIYVNYLYLIFAVFGLGLWMFFFSIKSYKRFKKRYGLINRFENYVLERKMNKENRDNKGEK